MALCLLDRICEEFYCIHSRQVSAISQAIRVYGRHASALSVFLSACKGLILLCETAFECLRRSLQEYFHPCTAEAWLYGCVLLLELPAMCLKNKWVFS